jgi:hypothetical protein
MDGKRGIDPDCKYSRSHLVELREKQVEGRLPLSYTICTELFSPPEMERYRSLQHATRMQEDEADDFEIVENMDLCYRRFPL